MKSRTLQQWLDWQTMLHPTAIDLGLERCSAVARKMGLDKLAPLVITVSGTNGKGSSVAMLDGVLRAAGYRVGAYTSPHLLRYNERVRLSGVPVADEALVEAFEAVDRARDDLTLTFFEFGTLAAAYLFVREKVDVALLEVGLGGRLDAVNVFTSDVALLTSIALDHSDWLGTDLSRIGIEKAGIFRPHHPAVCAAPNVPGSVIDYAVEHSVDLYLNGRDFFVEERDGTLRWRLGDNDPLTVRRPSLKGAHQVDNAAGVLAVLHLCGLHFSAEDLNHGLHTALVNGRYQTISVVPEVIIDVAHNPHAAESLSGTLRATGAGRHTKLLLGMFINKDIAGFVRSLDPAVDEWHIVALPPPRGADLSSMRQAVTQASPGAPVVYHDVLPDAYRELRANLKSDQRLIVTGSFETVSAVLALATDDGALET